MKRLRILLPLLRAMSAVQAGEVNPHLNGSSSVIFVSEDLRGYLAPCGCSEAMRGGIDRAVKQIAEARAANRSVLFVDGGDALFGKRALARAEVPQEELKARTLARAFKVAKLATRAIGELDNVRGAAFRKSLKLPEQENGTFRLFEQSGMKLAIAAAASEEELISTAHRARLSGAQFVLGLFHQTLEQAQRAASNPALEATLLFATRAADELDGEANRLLRTRVPVARVQSKGRSLARVDVFYAKPAAPFELQKTPDDVERELSSLDGRIELLRKELNAPGLGKEIKVLKQGKLDELVKRRQTIASTPLPDAEGNVFAVRFIPLEPSLPSMPEVKALIDRYDRDVGLLNLAWARKHGKDCPRPASDEAAYIGNEACRACHADAFPVWEGSKHARAYQTLVDVGRQYDLSCVGCHVIAYQKPGGVCRVDKVEGRKGVGCESCHGPGSIHSDEPEEGTIVAKPGKEDCVGCHNPENSSHFEFSTYLPQILGPGHGGTASGAKTGSQ